MNTNINTMTDAWDDALAVLAGIRKIGGAPVAIRPATADDTPVVITNDNDGTVVTVLRFEFGGWWKVTDAVGNVREAFPHNTHPRVMARKINSIHWDTLA